MGNDRPVETEDFSSTNPDLIDRRRKLLAYCEQFANQLAEKQYQAKANFKQLWETARFSMVQPDQLRNI